MKINELETPVYVIDEAALIRNADILSGIEKRTGGHILLAQKAFSAYCTYPILRKYLSGTSSSGLYEARLAHEEFGGENHVFSPAYTHIEMKELCRICDHVIFNSLSQLERHRAVWEQSEVSAGLRINPQYSTQSCKIYDPCAEFSRMGITRENFPDELPRRVEGIHFHTLCEQGAEPLEETFEKTEKDFGRFFRKLKWINLGGGHHITKDGYNIRKLESLIRYIRDEYDVTVYLEPGEAVALNAGYLIATVMDIIENGMTVLILDASAACHMPDVLEMPYRPPLSGAGMPGEKKFTCRLSCRTCLAGDVIGDYSFDEMPRVGDRLVFEDMAIYTMVKNNTFNGMPLPSIAVKDVNGQCRVVRDFGYSDFKGRLS